MNKANELAFRNLSEIIHSENTAKALHLIMHKLMGEGYDYDAAHACYLYGMVIIRAIFR